MSDQAYDPLAEFLADERAALGDDAMQFQQAGTPSATLSPPPATFAAPQDEPMDVDASMLDDPSPPAPLSPSSTTQFATLAVASPSPSPMQQQQSEFQQEWQAQQRQTVEQRDQQAREKHEQCVADAKASVDAFYAEYNERRDRAIADNRAAQEVDVQMAARGNLWERVLKQIDLATKAAPAEQHHPVRSSPGSQQLQQQQQKQAPRDTSRMRELLMDLKRDDNAPGVRQAKAQKA
ncbi:Clathrin light chain [Coemansia interrupta]|uniref:Clathrin light chain n=1 Tax=Coemansia interrupta TaxID=1126814 RepID=A0A9W8H4L9_9FUNG|nr:Clathrin light chain [Coemansia interrupta]